MPFDPTDHSTWTTFSDHPIFGETKSVIAEWSLDPSQYCDLGNYGHFMPEWYVHFDPPPSKEEQLRIANRDILNLSSVCAALKKAFGRIEYELVILDDFTVYVWVKNPDFTVEIYPNHDSERKGIVQLFAETLNDVIEEYYCATANDVVARLQTAIEA